jgi:acylphosphatase
MIQKRVIVSGAVQGVGFRASTLSATRKYPSLRGYVKNLPDGRVEAVFCGIGTEVIAMVEWCHHGPSFSNVTGVEVHDEPVSSVFSDFQILY